MDHADIVLMLDKKYSENPVPCPNDGLEVKMQCKKVRTDHGHLGVHKSASALVCGVCGYQLPIGV